MTKAKLFIALIAILTLTNSYAADSIVIDDFENETFQNWTTISCSSQRVDNPAPDDVNNSAKVLKCVRTVGSDNWAGVILRGVYALNIGTDADSYSFATVKYLKQTTGNVSFKLESGPDNATYEANMPYVATEGWSTITFDLRLAATGTYNDFFVMLDRSDNLSEAITVYIDDIVLTKKNERLGELNENYNPNAQIGTGETDGYHLVWQDLFDDGQISSVWNIEDNVPVYNNELQNYTRDNVTEGVDSEGNGCLIITARKGASGNKQCSSARLNTCGNMRVCHGKVEASIRFPKTANGLWPAFWMMGDNTSTWPANGEIDIMEMGNSEAFSKGVQDRFFNGACHWGPSSADHHMNTQSVTWDYSLQDGQFHLFTLIWDDKSIAMYVDKDRYPNVQPYFQLDISSRNGTSDPGTYFHRECHILLNMAIGGDFSNITDVNQITALNDGEAKMYVNYVKVYQKGEENESYYGPEMDFNDVKELHNVHEKLTEMGGCVYDITGSLVTSFKRGDLQIINNLCKGVYVIVFDDQETIKVLKKEE